MPARLIAVGLIWGALVTISGCSENRDMRMGGPPRSNLLMGREPSARYATQFVASDWPATPGRYQAPQESVYVEYYLDIQSNAQSQTYYPYRQFQAYTVGASRQ
jgi:hypothetical protein